MSVQDSASGQTARHPANFRTTQWSVVLAAGQGDEPQSRQALEELCSIYWRPLYTYLRREGTAPQDAQDLTQSFFAQLIEHHRIELVDPSNGRFRSFLLVSLKNFLANERERQRAQKRGGRISFISWEEANAEENYQATAALALPPDQAFAQSWATTMLEQVLAKLRADYVMAGQGDLFDALQIYLTGDKGTVPYLEMAARLNLGESAMKMSIQRLRRRFGEMLRSEIAQTVSQPEEVDEEIRALFAAARMNSSSA